MMQNSAQGTPKCALAPFEASAARGDAAISVREAYLALMYLSTSALRPRTPESATPLSVF